MTQCYSNIFDYPIPDKDYHCHQSNSKHFTLRYTEQQIQTRWKDHVIKGYRNDEKEAKYDSNKPLLPYLGEGLAKLPWFVKLVPTTWIWQAYVAHKKPSSSKQFNDVHICEYVANNYQVKKSDIIEVIEIKDDDPNDEDININIIHQQRQQHDNQDNRDMKDEDDDEDDDDEDDDQQPQISTKNMKDKPKIKSKHTLPEASASTSAEHGDDTTIWFNTLFDYEGQDNYLQELETLATQSVLVQSVCFTTNICSFYLYVHKKYM